MRGELSREERSARRFFVSGVVQGVGYRFFAQRMAERRGLAGYAKNLRDGRVEVYAVGSDDVLDLYRADLQRGPSSASVSGVQEEAAPLDPRFTQAFTIEFDN
jgi:acylphosphatase